MWGNWLATAAVLLGFFDNGEQFAIRGAINGALERLKNPACRELLTDFVDVNGRPLADSLAARGTDIAAAFAVLRFVDGESERPCRALQSRTMAFTAPRARIIHVCAIRFKDLFVRNAPIAEIVVIHEFLHTIGLGENPPTTDAITAQVRRRCG